MDTILILLYPLLDTGYDPNPLNPEIDIGHDPNSLTSRTRNRVGS